MTEELLIICFVLPSVAALLFLTLAGELCWAIFLLSSPAMPAKRAITHMSTLQLVAVRATAQGTPSNLQAIAGKYCCVDFYFGLGTSRRGPSA